MCSSRLWECPGTCFRREYSSANHNHYSNDLPFGLHMYNARRKVGNQPWLKQVSRSVHTWATHRKSWIISVQECSCGGSGTRHWTEIINAGARRWKMNAGNLSSALSLSGLFALMERIASEGLADVWFRRGLSVVGTTAHYETTQWVY